MENNQNDRFCNQPSVYRPHSANSVMDNVAFLRSRRLEVQKDSSVFARFALESQGIRTENNFGEKVTNRANGMEPVVKPCGSSILKIRNVFVSASPVLSKAPEARSS